MSERTLPRCTDCGLFSCRDRDKAYPGFCTTTNQTDPAELEELDRLYGSDTLDGRMARTAAEIARLCSSRVMTSVPNGSLTRSNDSRLEGIPL